MAGEESLDSSGAGVLEAVLGQLDRARIARIFESRESRRVSTFHGTGEVPQAPVHIDPRGVQSAMGVLSKRYFWFISIGADTGSTMYMSPDSLKASVAVGSGSGFASPATPSIQHPPSIKLVAARNGASRVIGRACSACFSQCERRAYWFCEPRWGPPFTQPSVGALSILHGLTAVQHWTVGRRQSGSAMEGLWIIGGFLVLALVLTFAVSGFKRGRSKSDSTGWTSKDVPPQTQHMGDRTGGGGPIV